MFSYTDDAIVTSSPTGRHLSTVIRHPAGMPDDQWRKHADQVCTVLNELDSKAKANSLSLHLQTVGRVKRDQLSGEWPRPVEGAYLGPFATAPAGEQVTELEMPIFYSQGICTVPATEATFASARIAELEKQLDDANARLECDRLVELSDRQLLEAQAMSPGSTMSIESQRVIIKRVE